MMMVDFFIIASLLGFQVVDVSDVQFFLMFRGLQISYSQFNRVKYSLSRLIINPTKYINCFSISGLKDGFNIHRFR
jgi:hypothetical protein